ncbi:MAG: hypothetical protein GY946_18215 [bacterium]|nr:hypothetical protein [bacterium]
MRELLKTEPYKSRFRFEVYGFTTPKGLRSQELYPFGPERHGFLVIEDMGGMLAIRPGHFYGEDEIRSDLDRIVASGGSR